MCRSRGTIRQSPRHVPHQAVADRFSHQLSLDLGDVRPSLAGPKRPQDRVLLDDMATGFDAVLDEQGIGPRVKTKRVPIEGANMTLATAMLSLPPSPHAPHQPKRHVGRGAGCPQCRCARAKS